MPSCCSVDPGQSRVLLWTPSSRRPRSGSSRFFPGSALHQGTSVHDAKCLPPSRSCSGNLRDWSFHKGAWDFSWSLCRGKQESVWTPSPWECGLGWGMSVAASVSKHVSPPHVGRQRARGKERCAGCISPPALTPHFTPYRCWGIWSRSLSAPETPFPD